MDLSQHAAYLKGLAEGKGLTKDEFKGDFVKALLDCLNDMAEEIESLEEYAEAIDEDLGDIEDLIFDDDEDFCDDDDLFVETECPVCGETIGYYHGVYDEPIEVLCPNCDAVVAVLGDDYEEVEDDEIVLEEELDED